MSVFIEDAGLLFFYCIATCFASKIIMAIFLPVLFYGNDLRRTDAGSSGNVWSNPAVTQLVQVLLQWAAFKQDSKIMTCCYSIQVVCIFTNQCS